MYYEFEGRQNMKTLIFDEDCLIVGENSYPYLEIESMEVTSAQLFATYGILTVLYKGKAITIPFPRSYSPKIRRAIKEMEREKARLTAASDCAARPRPQAGTDQSGLDPVSSQDGDSSTVLSMDPYEEIKKLKELLDLDIITDEEFAKKKKELLRL